MRRAAAIATLAVCALAPAAQARLRAAPQQVIAPYGGFGGWSATGHPEGGQVIAGQLQRREELTAIGRAGSGAWIPQKLTDIQQPLLMSSVAVALSGAAAVAFTEGGFPDAPLRVSIRESRLQAFTSQIEVAPWASWPAPVGVDNRGGVVAAYRIGAKYGRGPIYVAVRAPGSPTSHSTLVSGRNARGPALAMNSAGRAVIAWRERRLIRAVSVDDGLVGRTVTLGRTYNGEPSVAIGRRGECAVVWTYPAPSRHVGFSLLRASLRGASGPFGPAHERRRTTGGPIHPRAVIDDRGRAYLAWYEPRGARPGVIALRRVGPRGSGPLRIVGVTRTEVAPAMSLQADRLLIAWSGLPGARSQPVFARSGPPDRLGPRVQIGRQPRSYYESVSALPLPPNRATVLWPDGVGLVGVDLRNL